MQNQEINFLSSLWPQDQGSNRPSNVVSRNLKKIAIALAVVAGLVLVISFAPSVWYQIKGGAGSNSKVLARTDSSDFDTIVNGEPEVDSYQPRLDYTLPEDNRIVIPSAKIDTIVNEATVDNYEEALKLGVWRVSDFGDPYSRSRPTILAAHRFGYLKWSIPYRLKNSFYSLPKTQIGDTVEIYWRQRKYVYEVFAEEEGEEITNYKADLILYTCEDLGSPTRIFKYAKLIEV